MTRVRLMMQARRREVVEALQQVLQALLMTECSSRYFGAEMNPEVAAWCWEGALQRCEKEAETAPEVALSAA
jgi:hypothetical protein